MPPQDPAGPPLQSALERLLARADADPQLKQDLVDLAQAILARWEAPADLLEEPAAVLPGTSRLVTATGSPAQPDPRVLGQLLGLDFRPAWAKGLEAEVVPVAPLPRAVGDHDLAVAKDRCRARAAALRRLRLEEAVAAAPPAEERPEEAAGRQWAASLPWHVGKPLARSLTEVLEACADAMELLRLVRSLPEEDRQAMSAALPLAAEAQSMLRVLAEGLGPDRDEDQETLFQWLRELTHGEKYFVKRFMRLDDRADPARVARLRATLAEQTLAVTESRRTRKRGKDLWSRAGFHAAKIRAAGGRGDPEDWERLIAAAGELLELGTHPSDTRLRELLLHIYEDVPEGVAANEGFELVQREIDRFLSAQPQEDERRGAPALAPQVAEARRLLEGKTLLLIGGSRRGGAVRNLESAFGCSVRWCEVSEQAPRRSEWERAVQSREVDVVFLMVRWIRHAHGEVADVSAAAGKPCVRLPAGYHPNQVAMQVLKQVSRKI